MTHFSADRLAHNSSDVYTRLTHRGWDGFGQHAVACHSGWRGQSVIGASRKGRHIFFPASRMDAVQNIIGLSELLDDVGRDLEEFRKKHPTDYQLKTITMWWELERDRLLVRHADKRVLKRSSRRLLGNRGAFWILVIWTFMLVAISILRSLEHGRRAVVPDGGPCSDPNDPVFHVEAGTVSRRLDRFQPTHRLFALSGRWAVGDWCVSVGDALYFFPFFCMGQYFKAVNLDKREVVCLWCLDGGAKLWEWAANPQGSIFTLLLRKSTGSGGGDYYGYRTVEIPADKVGRDGVAQALPRRCDGWRVWKANRFQHRPTRSSAAGRVTASF